MYRTSVHPSNLLDMPRTNAALPPSPGMPLVHPFTSHFNLLASSRPVLCSALLCPAPFDKPRTSEYPPSSPTPSLSAATLPSSSPHSSPPALGCR